MTNIVFRINFFITNLANYLFSYFIPKTWLFYVSRFSYNHRQQQQEEENNHPHRHHQQQQQQVQQQQSQQRESNMPILQEVDTDELKRVFQMFDCDKDGMITKDELDSSLKKIGIFISNEEVAQMMDKVDVNGDGCIDVDEFKVLYQSITENNASIDVDMKEAFDVFDQNGDGFITADELKLVLASLGIGHGRETAEDCERMIRKVDEDGDGMVNFAEFKQMLTSFIH